jgi:hypothetical protein
MKVEELADSLKKKNYNVKIIKSGEYRAVEITGICEDVPVAGGVEGNGQSCHNAEIFAENCETDGK